MTMMIRCCEWLIIIVAVLSLTTSTRRRDRIYCTAAAAATPPFLGGGVGGGGNNNNKDPYAVLGVSSSASQDDIRRRYRELCLRYHPDKNVHLSTERERKECLSAFKDVQRANDEIGTAQSRRAHDDARRRRRAASYYFGNSGSQQRHHTSSSSSFSGSSGTTGTPSNGEDPTSGFDDLFRAFGSFANSSPSFVFHRGSGFPTTTTPESPSSYNNNAISSFVQTVKVPLRDLYAGKRSVLFRRRKNNRFDRYAAAFRGGAAYVVLYQSILFSIPLLQIVGRWASLAFGLIMFHHNLPRPNACDLYRADVKAGYKGGTKLKFRDGLDPRVEVSFVIEEEKHERYERIGDDLHVTATISREEAKSGCSFRIDPLDPSEEPVEVKVPPARKTTTTTTNNGSEQQQQHTTITVKGRGWPIRRTKNNRKGDLIVHIRVEKRGSRRRRRRRCRSGRTTTTTAGE